jgi:hypothetical protein
MRVKAWQLLNILWIFGAPSKFNTWDDKKIAGLVTSKTK